MSFWPFPKIILDELRAGLRQGPGLELGAGAGRLHERLAQAGIPLLTLDLQGSVDLRADARELPLASASLGLLVAANLLRHLDRGARLRVLGEAARTLAADGRLLLLEDDPCGRTGAERNYRRALELLAAADRKRGPALDLDAVLVDRPAGLSAPRLDLWLENEEPVVDPALPLNWLAARGEPGADALVRLARDVRSEGMSYGRFRACVLQRIAGPELQG